MQTIGRPGGDVGGGGHAPRDGETGAHLQTGQLSGHRQTPSDARVGAREPAPQQVRGRSAVRAAGRGLRRRLPLRHLRGVALRRAAEEAAGGRHVLPDPLRQTLEGRPHGDDRAVRR